MTFLSGALQACLARKAEEQTDVRRNGWWMSAVVIRGDRSPSALVLGYMLVTGAGGMITSVIALGLIPAKLG